MNAVEYERMHSHSLLQLHKIAFIGLRILHLSSFKILVACAT